MLTASLPAVALLEGAVGESGANVPVPRVGGRYDYQTENGTNLTVEVVGEGERLGRGLETRTAGIINWRLSDPDRYNGSFRFQESVVGDGRVVQQVAHCGRTFKDSIEDEQWQCDDERALIVTASASLPAAFGAGPFWGDPLPAETLLNVEAPLLDDELHYAGTQVNETCARFTTVDPVDPARVRSLEFSTVNGPLTLCTHVPFPTSFRTLGGMVFHLQDHEAGDGQRLEVADGETGTDGPAGLPLESRSSPFLVDPEPDPWSKRLTVREAHRIAENESSTYRDMLDESENPLVVKTLLRKDSQRRTGLDGYPQRHLKIYQRNLVLANGSGQAVEALVEKAVERWSVLGQSIYRNNTYVAWDKGPHEAKTPTWSTANRTQAGFPAAVDIGERLSGANLSGVTGIGMMTKYRDHGWGPGQGRPTRTDGYTVKIWMDGSTTEDTSVPASPKPYPFVADGPTGWVLWFSVQRERLPITGESLS